MRYLPLVLLASCGFLFPDFLHPFPAPQCVTPCGEKYYPAKTSPESGCADLSAEEERFVAAVASRWPDACLRLKDTQVAVHDYQRGTDGGYWVDSSLRRVAGLMGCRGRDGAKDPWLVVATDDYFKNATAHEQIHLMECPSEDPGHLGWADAGYLDFIRSVSVGPSFTDAGPEAVKL